MYLSTLTWLTRVVLPPLPEVLVNRLSPPGPASPRVLHKPKRWATHGPPPLPHSQAPDYHRWHSPAARSREAIITSPSPMMLWFMSLWQQPSLVANLLPVEAI